MTLTIRPNTTADAYLNRTVPPGAGDVPDVLDCPVQQWPPFFVLNADQVTLGGLTPSFLIERGLIVCPVLLRRSTGTLSDWLVIDPFGARIVLQLMEAHHRIESGEVKVSMYFAKSTLSL